TIRHGIACIQREIEESGFELRRINVAKPQSIFGLHLHFASRSDGLANEPLELENELAGVDQLGGQRLPPRKRQELRRQLCSAINGALRRCGELADFANVGRRLDEFKVPRDHRKQVIEVVPDAAGELADGLHLLALVELLLDQTTSLQRMLVLGDVSEE